MRGLQACLITLLTLMHLGGICAGAAQHEPELAVVVSRLNSTSAVELDTLAQIYRRKMRYWQDGRKIEPVNLPATEPLRQMFSRRVLKMEPEELEAYWNQQYFQGVFPPYMLPSEEAVIRFVADTPGAIGYVSACAADSRIAVLAYLRGGEAQAHPAKNQDCSP